MPAYVALLRAVFNDNSLASGPHNKVSMADLKALAERGLTGARTLLQSGNLVFQTKARSSASLEKLLEGALRSADEWRDTLEANPFPKEATSDPGHLVVMPLKAMVKVIEEDWSLRCLASFIIRLDEIDRFNAFSNIDFSWNTLSDDADAFNERVPLGVMAKVYEIVRLNGRRPPQAPQDGNPGSPGNPGYDIDAQLQGLIVGSKTAFCPSSGGGDIFMRVPRGKLGAILPEMSRAPRGGYSQAAATSRGTLLNQLRVSRQADNVTVDAGLAATVAANWTAARAGFLASAQSDHPDRGYT